MIAADNAATLLTLGFGYIYIRFVASVVQDLDSVPTMEIQNSCSLPIKDQAPYRQSDSRGFTGQ